MQIAARILQLINNEGIRIGTFEKTIGASKGLIRKAIKNNTDIQSKWVTVIAENYTQYNPRWLLTGKGEMLLSEAEETLQSLELQKKDWEIDRLKEEISQLKTENAHLNKTIGKLESQLEISDTSYKSNVG